MCGQREPPAHSTLWSLIGVRHSPLVRAAHMTQRGLVTILAGVSEALVPFFFRTVVSSTQGRRLCTKELKLLVVSPPPTPMHRLGAT